jgi:uncharacterized phage protein gp47/JayE
MPLVSVTIPERAGNRDLQKAASQQGGSRRPATAATASLDESCIVSAESADYRVSTWIRA